MSSRTKKNNIVPLSPKGVALTPDGIMLVRLHHEHRWSRSKDGKRRTRWIFGWYATITGKLKEPISILLTNVAPESDYPRRIEIRKAGFTSPLAAMESAYKIAKSMAVI